MKLEERVCACGCGKTFRCLPTSQTKYSSLHCMELAGALPPVEKFGRPGKAGRPAAGATAKEESEEDAEPGFDDEETPMLLEEDDSPEPDSKNPPEIDPAA